MRLSVLLFLLLAGFTSHAAEGLVIAGKIKSLRPVAIRLVAVTGKQLLHTTTAADGRFSMGPLATKGDVYTLFIGDLHQSLYLDNNTVTIQGYFDPVNADNNNLSFDGIAAHQQLEALLPAAKQLIDTAAAWQLPAIQLAPLAYLAGSKEYQLNVNILRHIPAADRQTGAAIWLQHCIDSLERYLPGKPAPDFALQGRNGQLAHLADFRGKYLVMDFWASWCGPCRQEMQLLKPIYDAFKDKEVAFISVSLDDTKAAWEKGMSELQLPWNMLWDPAGFNHSALKESYGFHSIPFIVLIDPEGKIVARKLRGEAVRNALEKVIKK